MYISHFISKNKEVNWAHKPLHLNNQINTRSTRLQDFYEEKKTIFTTHLQLYYKALQECLLFRALYHTYRYFNDPAAFIVSSMIR